MKTGRFDDLTGKYSLVTYNRDHVGKIRRNEHIWWGSSCYFKFHDMVNFVNTDSVNCHFLVSWKVKACTETANVSKEAMADGKGPHSQCGSNRKTLSATKSSNLATYVKFRDMESKPVCFSEIFCQQEHDLDNCPKFLDISMDEKCSFIETEADVFLMLRFKPHLKWMSAHVCLL